MQKSKKLKLLIVSRSLPPSKGGSAFVIGNLASNFSNDELVVLGGSSKLITPTKNIDGIKYNYQFTQLSLMGRGGRYLKLFRWLLFPFLVQKIKSICKEEEVSDVMGVYPDIFFTYAAYFAAKKLNLNYYSYFHNTYLENRKGIHLWFAKKYSQKYLRLLKKYM